MKRPPNLNEMKFSRFDDGHGGRKAFDRAMHSQGMKVNDEDPPGGDAGSHRRYSLTPLKKGEEGTKIKTVPDGNKPTHLGYDIKKNSTMWTTGKKALRDYWRKKGKTKENSDKSPEAKDRRKKEAAKNKERKRKERNPFTRKRKSFKEFYQPTMDSL